MKDGYDLLRDEFGYKLVPSKTATFATPEEAIDFIRGQEMRTAMGDRDFVVRTDAQNDGYNRAEQVERVKNKGVSPKVQSTWERNPQWKEAAIKANPNLLSELETAGLGKGMGQGRFYIDLNHPSGPSSAKFYLNLGTPNNPIYAVQTPVGMASASDLWNLEGGKPFGGLEVSHNEGMQGIKKVNPVEEKLHGRKLGERLSSKPSGSGEVFVARPVAHGEAAAGGARRVEIGRVVQGADGLAYEINIPEHYLTAEGEAVPFGTKHINATGKPPKMPTVGSNIVNFVKKGAPITALIESGIAMGDAADRAKEKLADEIAALPPRTEESYRPFQWPAGVSPIGLGSGLPLTGSSPDMRESRMIMGEVATDPKFYGDIAYGTVNTLGGRILDRQKENYQKWEGNPLGQYFLSPIETVAETPYNLGKDIYDMGADVVNGVRQIYNAAKVAQKTDTDYAREAAVQEQKARRESEKRKTAK